MLCFARASFQVLLPRTGSSSRTVQFCPLTHTRTRTRTYATMSETLPVGKHDLQLYSIGTPNGLKISIMLEELGVAYDAWRIDIRNGDQFGAAFAAKQPNK